MKNKFLAAVFFAMFFSGAALAQNALYIDSSGKVGIGVSKPVTNLHVNGAALFTGSTDFQIPGKDGLYLAWNYWGFNEADFITHTTNSTNGYGGAKFFNVDASGNPVSLATLTGTGNLGIGTDQPNYKLTIAGSGNVLALDNGGALVAKNAAGTYEEFLWPRYTDNMMYLDYGAAGFNIRNVAGAPTMFMTPGNKIGIGNITPYGSLDVSGNIYTSIHGNEGNEHDPANAGLRRIGMAMNGNTGDFTGMELVTERYSCGNGGIIKFMTWGCNTTTTKEAMRINELGAVGINTTNPTAPLTVGASKANYYSIQDQVMWLGYRYNSSGSNSGYAQLTDRAGNSANFDLSIYATGGVMASNFYAFSDVRIKQNLQLSLPRNDLFLLNQLKVTDYQYKDGAMHGSNFYKGFIAQDVEKILPGAVNRHPDFVPDVFAMSTQVIVDKGVLTVTLKSPHHLAKGDMVRLITKDNQTKEATVSTISGNSFTITDWTGDDGQLFVYGKKVNDFRTVDYQQVFSMGIGAIQELSATVDDLKKRLGNEEKALKALADKVEAITKNKK